MFAEEDTTGIIAMEAGSEESIQDNSNQDPEENYELPVVEEESINEEDERAIEVYTQALKQYTRMEVCGKKKKKHFIYPTEPEE